MHATSTAAAAAAKTAKLAADAKQVADDKAANKVRQANVIKAINNTKFTTKKQEDIFNLIYTTDANTGSSKMVTAISHIIENKPEHLVQLAMMFDGYTDEKGFDQVKLTKQIESDVVKKTKAKIKRKTKASARGSQTNKNKLNHKTGIDDWLSDVEL